MLKRTLAGVAIAGLLVLPLTIAAHAEMAGEETRAHPEMAHAIHVLEDSIAHMEAQNHDFGGRRARAISASRKAIRELRASLFYREPGEEHGEHAAHKRHRDRR